METETTEPEVEATDAEVNAGFAAGFQSVDSTPPTEAPAPAVPEPVAETPVAPEPPPPEPKYVQVTEDDYKRLNDSATKVPEISAALEKLSGSIYGRIDGRVGTIEERLKQIQAATPQGRAVTVKAEDFGQLNADFPDMVKHQVEAINKALANVGGTAPTFDETRVTDLITPHVQKVRDDAALQVQKAREDAAFQIMDMVEPEWRETVKTKEWVDWFTAQPPEYQQQVGNSWHPSDLRNALKKFKSQPAKHVPPGSSRQRQLEKAITPRGVGGVPTTDTSVEAEFEKGFKEAFR